MPKRSWDGRRQREFERIRERLLLQGEPEGMAEQIAVSRVNRDLPVDDGPDQLAMVAQIRTSLRPPRDQEQQAWRSLASRPRNRGGARRVVIAGRRASSARLA